MRGLALATARTRASSPSGRSRLSRSCPSDSLCSVVPTTTTATSAARAAATASVSAACASPAGGAAARTVATPDPGVSERRATTSTSRSAVISARAVYSGGAT